MKKISKKIALLCVIILILATFCSCRPSNYSKHFDTTFLFDVNWMIGKNSNEIQKRYGVFDNNNIPDQEKTYIDAVGMYLTDNLQEWIDSYLQNIIAYWNVKEIIS